MEIKLFNSLNNKLEVFKPIEENKITCYVCGPTVYNYVHIGNMRPVVVFDVLRRFLMYIGYEVNFISNFTDIDDKIIKQAKLENLSEKEVADKYIEAFEKDRENMHALKPTHQPRVIETMPLLIDFIEKLIEKGYAYEAQGDVYFRVGKIKDYGILSNIKMDDLLVGARIEENSIKESPLDFALWKKTDDGIQFDSPWSKGRPGWHSECVVMINSLVPGGHIDIHGGGFDLKFPHHTNEIAQSEALNGNKIANYWLHNGFINIDNVKMSKSLGNFVTAKDLIQAYGGNVVRFILINAHYRAPVNFSSELAIKAQNDLDKISMAYNKLAIKLQLEDINIFAQYNEKKDIDTFLDALADDLNTSNALTELYRVIKEGNILLRTKPFDQSKALAIFNTIKDMLSILGLEIFPTKLSLEDKNLFSAYEESKQNKNYELSDSIRKQLMERKLL